MIGGGPAGLAAAVYGASEGLRTIVIERRGARRPGRDVVADRELPRLPVRRLGRRAQPARAAAGAAARRRDPRHALDHRHRPRHAHRPPRRRRRAAHAHDHPRDRRDLAAPPDRGHRARSSARASTTAPRAARRPPRTASTSTSSAPGTRPGRPRSSSPTTRAASRIVCRGDSLEKSMSQYLVDQVAPQAEHPVALGSEVAAVHGDAKLEAIDILDRATGDDDPPRVRRPLHLHRRRRRHRLAAATRSRSTSAATCSRAPTSARPAAGRSSATRSCSRRACPGIFACRRRALQPGQARRRGRRRRQHGHRLRAPVPARRVVAFGRFAGRASGKVLVERPVLRRRATPGSASAAT